MVYIIKDQSLYQIEIRHTKVEEESRETDFVCVGRIVNRSAVIVSYPHQKVGRKLEANIQGIDIRIIIDAKI